MKDLDYLEDGKPEQAFQASGRCTCRRKGTTGCPSGELTTIYNHQKLMLNNPNTGNLRTFAEITLCHVDVGAKISTQTWMVYYKSHPILKNRLYQ